MDDPADSPPPNNMSNSGSISLPLDCAPVMVPRIAEAHVQWVLSALTSILGLDILELTARALVTIPVSDQSYCTMLKLNYFVFTAYAK